MSLWFAIPIGTVVLALGTYSLLRWFFGERSEGDDKNLSMAVITRLGTLHALILALIFAAEMHNYQNIDELVNQETSAVADTYYGVQRYLDGTSDHDHEIERNIALYIKAVIDEEWSLLDSDRSLSSQAWKHFSTVDVELLKLNPTSEYQTVLKAQLVADWDDVSQYRRGREAAAMRDIPNIFWALSVVGFLSVIFPYFVFAPRPTHLLILAVFALYNGLTFSAILELSKPFSGTGMIEPTAYERLYSDDMIFLIQK